MVKMLKKLVDRLLGRRTPAGIVAGLNSLLIDYRRQELALIKVPVRRRGYRRGRTPLPFRDR